MTKAPDIRYTAGKESICIARWPLAVDRKISRDAKENQQNQQTADFIYCIAFGKTAEAAEKYLVKGTKILVEGRIQTGSYTNNQGQKVYTTDVAVENLEFCESKKTADENAAGSQRGSSGGYQQQSRQQAPETDKDGFMNIPDGVEDEGLPFN